MASITAKRLAAASDATVPALSLVAERMAKVRAAKVVRRSVSSDPYRRRNPRLPGGCYVTRQDTFLARKDLREAGLIPFAKGLPTAAQRSARGKPVRGGIVLRSWTLTGQRAALRLAESASREFQGLASPGGLSEPVERFPLHGCRVYGPRPPRPVPAV